MWRVFVADTQSVPVFFISILLLKKQNNNKVNLICYSKAGNVSEGMSIICQAISDTTEDIIKLIRIPNRYVFSRSSIVCNII